MVSPQDAPALDKAKVEKASAQLFSVVLENELNEAEAMSAIIMTLAMRTAYACRTMEELDSKLAKAAEFFQSYYRINLSSIQSAMLAKEAAIQEAN